MTADTKEPEPALEQKSAEANNVAMYELPVEIVEIIEFLSLNNKIIFKSQQIDDPELQRSEKIAIAKEIYIKNRQTFLMRFGCYFEERHLSSFARLAIATAPLKTEEHCEEMQLMLYDYRQKLQTRKLDVKNRRYAAMQRLIQQGEYFSEQEMMKRAPELYQELIGQYLSEAEKKQRDCYDVKNTTFSGILMHKFEQERIDDVLKQADQLNQVKALEEVESEDDETHTQPAKLHDDVHDMLENATISANIEDNYDVEIPASFQQQWGNFDNENIACSTSKVTSRPKNTNPNSNLPSQSTLKSKQKLDATKLISAGERDLLRQEFIGIMHEQFLAGDDKDFDYTQVDDDTQLDDLHQLNQDKEDRYFENSDDDDVAEIEKCDNLESINNDEESEDELDIYMSHLNKHHSLQI